MQYISKACLRRSQLLAVLCLGFYVHMTTALRRPPHHTCADDESHPPEAKTAGQRTLLSQQERKLFENERCLVTELKLGPGEEGWVTLGGQYHLFLQVGRGSLQALSSDDVSGAKLLVMDGTALWDPFGPQSASSSLGLRNTHPNCHSRSIIVSLKESAAGGGMVWRGEAVRPGRRFEEEEWREEDEERDSQRELRAEEERVLGEESFRTDIGTELLLSNEEVRVWSFIIQPGEDAPIHRHENSYFFINLGESETCGLHYNGTVQAPHNCGRQDDGLVTWIDCSVGRRHQRSQKKVLNHVHGVRNVGTTWFRQYIVEFLR